MKDGSQKVADLISPKLKITGNPDGAEIGMPNHRFNKCRVVGDDICEYEIIIEE